MSLTEPEMEQLHALRDRLLDNYGKGNLWLPDHVIIDASEQLNLPLLQAYESMISQGYINEDIKSAITVTQRIECSGTLTTDQLDIISGVERALSNHACYLFDEDNGTPLEQYDPVFKVVLENAEYAAQLLILIKERRILDAQSLEPYLSEIKQQHAATFDGVL